MPFVVDRNGRPVYPQIPFGFGVALRAPARPIADDSDDDDYGADGAAPVGRGGVQSLPNWSGGAPQPLNVQDGSGSDAQTWRPGGFTPVLPDVFSEWRKHATAGMMGLLHALRPPSNMSGMGEDTPECRAEWAKAYKWCEDELSKDHPERSTAYRNVEDCARGEVSSRCGGNNKADMKVEPPPGNKPPEEPKKLEDADADARKDAGAGRDEEIDDCHKERMALRRQCAKELAKDNPNTAITSGYRNIEDCVTALLSKACGGTIKPPPPPRVKRYNLRPRRKR
ncbi:MAG: hypothetical protein P4M07_28235 [Xanthobacteraceae bacterium]|nr:hypothetical protein [Xanthobacteraceae bacterium]